MAQIKIPEIRTCVRARTRTHTHQGTMEEKEFPVTVPWHKGSKNGSKLQQHVGNSTAQVFREWEHATIVCWHYNGTGVQRMGHTTIVCWHYNGIGVQKTGVGHHNLLALQWHRGSENRGRLS